MGVFNHYAAQKAVYGTLAGDSALMAQVSGIYDFVPAGAAFPYITLGDIKAEDASTATSQASRLKLMLHIYSRERGRKEIDALMERVHFLLHDAMPKVDGYAVANLRYVGSEIGMERDGLTFHGKIRFDALLEKV